MILRPFVPAATMMQPTEAPPTGTGKLGSRPARSFRWWPVTLMLACSFLSYVDRQILAVLSPMILPDLRLNAQRYGEIVSSFSVAYMVGNPAWGAILDRIGLRRAMTIAVTLWTIACGAHAVLSGFLGFAIARAALGFGEGATFPGGLRTAMDSLPTGQQSRGIAVAYSGGSLGALLTPLLVTPIALAYGWRAAFVVTAIAGFAWVVVWRTTMPLSATGQTDRIVLPNPFERRFWSLVAAYALGALPIGLILYLAPLYLTQALRLTQGQLGRVLWIPPLGWEAGYFAWGWLMDRFIGANPRPSWLFFALAVLGLPLMAVPVFHDAALVLGLMFWSMFVAAGFVIAALRTAALAYPSEQTGLVAGIGAGSWSAIVAAVLPSLGHMFDVKHYANAFLFCALLPVIGAFCWWSLTLPVLHRPGEDV
jgi:MFS transporter, ACS family, hexuronate transporter